MLKEKNLESQKRIETLTLELTGLKDANDKNNFQKLK